MFHEEPDIEFVAPPGGYLNVTFSETVVVVNGSAPGLSIGNRVAGIAHGGVWKDLGAFANYLRVPADLCWKKSPRVGECQKLRSSVLLTSPQGR